LSDVLRVDTVIHAQLIITRSEQDTSIKDASKSFLVQTNKHFVTVARCIEHNALQANLVTQANDWQWGSLWRRTQGHSRVTGWLNDRPVMRPRD
jgi:hypothetical protein